MGQAFRVDARIEPLACRNSEADIIHCRLDKTSFTSLAYDPESYDDLPTYSWDEDLDLDSFAKEIDLGNDNLFGFLRILICGKLGINVRQGGCEL